MSPMITGIESSSQDEFWNIPLETTIRLQTEMRLDMLRHVIGFPLCDGAEWACKIFQLGGSLELMSKLAN